MRLKSLLLSALVLCLPGAAGAYTFANIDFPSADSTTALGINNNNDIVGIYDKDGATRGFVLEGNTYSTLAYPGADYTIASGINDSGDVVGYYGDASGEHGFRYSNGAFAAPIDYNGSRTQLYDINNSGLISGAYINNNFYPAGSFLYDGTEFVEVKYPFLEATEETVVMGINNLGQGAGYYFSAGYYGFLYDGNTYLDVNFDSPTMTESVAFDVNDNGVVLGNYFDGVSGTFIFDGSEYSSILFPGAGRTDGASINNAGAIVGSYDFYHSFYGVPSQSVPEPSVMVLFGLGAACVFAARARSDT